MTDDDVPVPLEACTLPGTIKLTDRALKLAEEFQTAVPSGWIMAFASYEGSRMRASKDAPWVDTGPGIDLGGYKIGQIPAEAVYRHGSLSYAVLISKEMVASHPEKTIDLDDAGKIVLR